MLLVSSAVTAMLLMSQKDALPNISGVWLKSTSEIKPFELIDHSGQSFTQENLTGRWSLIAYGYTYCPDYCPVILSTLSQVNKELLQRDQFQDLSWLFYSVDHERDSVERLSSYLAYFDTPYIGLTAKDSESYKSFELSLGIYYEKDLASEVKHQNHHGYIVNHSLMLLLINPQGELQAVLRPQQQQDGRYAFSAETILADYIAIREYSQ